MPLSIEQLFKESGKEITGRVKWGQIVSSTTPGVYVVALTRKPETSIFLGEAPISKAKVAGWIQYVPKLVMDHTRPLCDALVNRLNQFWFTDETILYIGKAGTSLRTRINQYYNTKLGDPKPHAGGHWIKTLENLDELNIYWTSFQDEDPQDVEGNFLKTFTKNVSNESKFRLYDPEHPFPFANLEYPKGIRKAHGLRNQINR